MAYAFSLIASLLDLMASTFSLIASLLELISAVFLLTASLSGAIVWLSYTTEVYKGSILASASFSLLIAYAKHSTGVPQSVSALTVNWRFSNTTTRSFQKLY